MQVLMHKSHDLLKEEITLTIFHMANVDFNAFFKQFLAEFLSKMDDLDSNQREKLQMTFKDDVVRYFYLLFMDQNSKIYLCFQKIRDFDHFD